MAMTLSGTSERMTWPLAKKFEPSNVIGDLLWASTRVLTSEPALLKLGAIDEKLRRKWLKYKEAEKDYQRVFAFVVKSGVASVVYIGEKGIGLKEMNE